ADGDRFYGGYGEYTVKELTWLSIAKIGNAGSRDGLADDRADHEAVHTVNHFPNDAEFVVAVCNRHVAGEIAAKIFSSRLSASYQRVHATRVEVGIERGVKTGIASEWVRVNVLEDLGIEQRRKVTA